MARLIESEMFPPDNFEKIPASKHWMGRLLNKLGLIYFNETNQMIFRSTDDPTSYFAYGQLEVSTDDESIKPEIWVHVDDDIENPNMSVSINIPIDNIAEGIWRFLPIASAEWKNWVDEERPDNDWHIWIDRQEIDARIFVTKDNLVTLDYSDTPLLTYSLTRMRTYKNNVNPQKAMGAIFESIRRTYASAYAYITWLNNEGIKQMEKTVEEALCQEPTELISCFIRNPALQDMTEARRYWLEPPFGEINPLGCRAIAKFRQFPEVEITFLHKLSPYNDGEDSIWIMIWDPHFKTTIDPFDFQDKEQLPLDGIFNNTTLFKEIPECLWYGWQETNKGNWMGFALRIRPEEISYLRQQNHNEQQISNVIISSAKQLIRDMRRTFPTHRYLERYK